MASSPLIPPEPEGLPCDWFMVLVITRRLASDDAHTSVGSRQRPFMCTALGIKQGNEQFFTAGLLYPIKKSLKRTKQSSRIIFKFECIYFLVAITYYPFDFIYAKHIVLPLYGRLHLLLSRAGLPVHHI